MTKPSLVNTNGVQDIRPANRTAQLEKERKMNEGKIEFLFSANDLENEDYEKGYKQGKKEMAEEIINMFNRIEENFDFISHVKDGNMSGRISLAQGNWNAIKEQIKKIGGLE